MIGSLLFYGLYPLTRYFSNKRASAAEASKKKTLPPALVNGVSRPGHGLVGPNDETPLITRPDVYEEQRNVDVWKQTVSEEDIIRPKTDGEQLKVDALKPQVPEEDIRPEAEGEQLKVAVIKQQVPEDDVANLKLEAEGEQLKVPVLKEQVLGEDKRSETDGELLKVACDETKNELALNNAGLQSTVLPEEEEKMSNENLKDEAKAAQQEDHEVCVHHEEMNMKERVEEETVALGEMINPWTLQNQSSENIRVEEMCPMLEKIPVASMEKSLSRGKASIAGKECWDEYITGTGEINYDTICPPLDLVSLLSELQTQPRKTLYHGPQPGWHNPEDPGLAEASHYLSVEFPSLSYYPPLQQTTPCEASFSVVWRAWEEVTESPTVAESVHKFSASQDVLDFTVMSYNILAQDLLEANQKLYSHCPLEVLQWSYRYHHLTEDIQKWAPDILCLQEVQENHYKEQLHPFLSQMGYSCVYKRRTGIKTDGCATCYRGDVFSELSVTLLEFYRPETGLLNQDNVGIVLLLQPVASSTHGSEVKAKGPLLCVANTHLLFNPRRGDVKLTQLAIVLAEISRVVKFCKDREDHCNIILCGDFNSVPHTPLYQLITNGQLFYHGLPSWMISGQEDLSYRAYQHRVFAPLWPSSLGITDNCQYTTDKDKFKRGTQESGKLQYDHDFLLQLRFSAAACVRPLDLDLIDYVTDNTPDASRDNQQCVCSERLGHSICHGLNLHSAYKHILPGSGRNEITTLHSDVGDTVDYIFYSPKCTDTADVHTGDSHLEGAGLKLIGYLPLLSEDVIWSMKGLPNEVFPSDHLSLLAKFQMDLLPA